MRPNLIVAIATTLTLLLLPTTLSFPLLCVNLGKIFGSELEVGSCSSTDLQVGVGGSAGSCTRKYQAPIFYVPLSSALDAASTATLTVDVSDASSLDGLGAVDLVGLPLTLDPTPTDADWYLGPSSSLPQGQELISGDVIPSDASDGDVVTIASSETLLPYLRSQMELHAASASAGSIAFAALRLAGADTLGCDLACDSSCSIKRVKLDATTLSLDVDLSSAVNSDTGNTKPSHQSRLVTAECNDDGTISLEYERERRERSERNEGAARAQGRRCASARKVLRERKEGAARAQTRRCASAKKVLREDYSCFVRGAGGSKCLPPTTRT
jgi:hypothetical protein